MKTLQRIRCCTAAASFLLLAFVTCGALTEPVTDDSIDTRVVYDQRQTGKYNIHVSIKDVAIIEMDQNEIQDESFGDEEYYYDEEDLTVKPIKFPSSTTMQLSDLTTYGQKTSKAPSVNITSTNTPDNADDFPITSVTAKTIFDSSPSAETSTKIAVPTEISVPAQPITDPATQPKERQAEPRSKVSLSAGPMSKEFPLQGKAYNSQDHDSRIYKFKAQRTNKQTPGLNAASARRCRSNQYRDLRGNCRIKRSSSILKKLFSMLVSFPYANERTAHNKE